MFFDFVTHFGGAQQCTVLLCQQLAQFNELHVIDAYGFCDKYVNALSKCGIQPMVLIPGAKYVYIGSKDKPLKRILSLAKQLPIFLKLRKQIIKHILKLEPDVIWTNSTKALMFLLTSWRLHKYPVVMYAHGWARREEVSVIRRWLIKKADAVFAVSNATAQALQSWGVKKDKIFVVYHAIDFDRIIEDSQKEFVTRPPRMDKPLKILVPSCLLRAKGQHTAIEAACLLKKKGLDFVMWLAGDVKMGAGDEYQQYLRKLICDYGLEANVFLLGYRKDVLALMRLSDVVIFPTHTEGLGRVIEEAMMLKRPVISNPTGGVTDLIIDGETGLLGSIDNAEGIVKNLEKLMLDKDLENKMTNQAYEYLRENFSLNRHVELVESAFEQLLLINKAIY